MKPLSLIGKIALVAVFLVVAEWSGDAKMA
jgi:hypothetical protein